MPEPKSPSKRKLWWSPGCPAPVHPAAVVKVNKGKGPSRTAYKEPSVHKAGSEERFSYLERSRFAEGTVWAPGAKQGSGPRCGGDARAELTCWRRQPLQSWGHRLVERGWRCSLAPLPARKRPGGRAPGSVQALARRCPSRTQQLVLRVRPGVIWQGRAAPAGDQERGAPSHSGSGGLTFPGAASPRDARFPDSSRSPWLLAAPGATRSSTVSSDLRGTVRWGWRGWGSPRCGKAAGLLLTGAAWVCSGTVALGPLRPANARDAVWA